MIKSVFQIEREKILLEQQNIERLWVGNGEIDLTFAFSDRQHFTGLKKIGSGYNADVYCCTQNREILKIGDPISLTIEIFIYNDLKRIGFPVLDTKISNDNGALLKPYLDPNLFANKIKDFSELQKEKLQEIWKMGNEYAIITGIPLDLKADNLWWDEKNKTWILVDTGPKLDKNDPNKFEFTLDLKSGKDFIRKIKGEYVETCHISFSYKKELFVKCKNYGFYIPITEWEKNYNDEKKKLENKILELVKSNSSESIFQAIFYLKCVPITDKILELAKSNIVLRKQLCKTYFVCVKEDMSIEKSFKQETKTIIQLRRDTKKYNESLNSKDREAISSYTGTGFSSINNCLRNGTDSLNCNDEIKNKIVRLDKILTDKNAPRLKENITVFRGIDDFKSEESRRIAFALENLQPGDLWEDRGFVSTSVQHPPQGFVGKSCCLFEINLRKGTPAYYIGKESSNSNEEEVILLPGIVLKFIGKRTGEKGILYRGKYYVDTYIFECAGCDENTRFAISPMPKEIDNDIKRETLSFQPVDRFVGKDRLSYFHLTDMYNKYIPKKNKNIFRLMSWNIHEWKNKDKEKNKNGFLTVFKSLNPDILGLQEVTDKSYGFGCEADIGSYGERLRNDIIVKKSIDKFLEVPKSIEHERCMIIVGIVLNGEKIIIGNLHLDVKSSENRIDNINASLEAIEQIAKEEGTDNIILMGDFNSYRIGDYNEQNYRELVKLKSGLSDGMNIFETIDILEKRGYKDTFTIRKVLPPINTNFYGGRIDFIFLKGEIINKLIGTYAYYSSLSDHIAIIADFSFNNLGEDLIIGEKEKEKISYPTDFFKKDWNELLLFGAEKGTLFHIEAALNNGADIHYLQDNALIKASEKGHLKVVEFLIKKGGNVNAQNDLSLKLASMNGHLEVVKYLIRNGANVKADNNAALEEAKTKKHTKVVEFLELQLKPRSEKLEYFNKLLIKSVENNDLNGIRDALNNGADIHYMKEKALYFAAQIGNIEIGKYLIEKGAEITKDILQYSSQDGMYKFFKLLLSYNIDIKNLEYVLKNATRRDGFHYLYVVQDLIQKGAKNIEEALEFANKYGKDAKIIEYLKSQLNSKKNIEKDIERTIPEVDKNVRGVDRETSYFIKNFLIDKIGLRGSIYDIYKMKVLDLSNKKIVNIPKEIGNLINLEELSLANNKIKEIPEEIGKLVNLRKLYLQNNFILKIPESLGKLKKLEELLLYNNRLLIIPNSLGNLAKLRELRIYGNDLINIPLSLEKLVNLKELYLPSTIMKIPPGVKNISGIEITMV